MPATFSKPTGLDRAVIHAELSPDERKTLALWMRSKAGKDGGRFWWPARIRNMALAERMDLAADPEKDLRWEVREIRWVRESLPFFTFQYGHMQPEEGPPIPISPWAGVDGHMGQTQVLETFATELRSIVLKARQLGLTWLALHYAFHLMAFNAVTANAKVLALSKRQEDSNKLLLRVRRINDLLPPYLRQREDTESVGSLRRFKLTSVREFAGGGGELTSLPGKPGAARMETATLALLDEFAHFPNKWAGPTWTAAQPTLGRRGRAIVIFTGNGPAEAPGDGQAAAKLWARACSGAEKLTPVFLPSSTDPSRTEAWRDDETDNYLTDEEFEAEYPETEEQALQGVGGVKVYPPAGINAAEALGREFTAELREGRMAPPLGDQVAQGIDWGERTHGLVIWPLEAGGIYVPPSEIVRAHGEPGDATEAMFDILEEIPRWEVELEPDPDEVDDDAELVVPSSNGHLTIADLEEARYDAAGVQSMRTFVKIARRRRPDLPTFKVPFGDYKQETIQYLRRLFRRAERGKRTQVIAIAPENKVLLRQLRGLVFKDDDSGKVEKGDDHGPDALVAGAAPIAARFREPAR